MLLSPSKEWFINQAWPLVQRCAGFTLRDFRVMYIKEEHFDFVQPIRSAEQIHLRCQRSVVEAFPNMDVYSQDFHILRRRLDITFDDC